MNLFINMYICVKYHYFCDLSDIIGMTLLRVLFKRLKYIPCFGEHLYSDETYFTALDRFV